jgi:hypothetical protein
MMSGQAAPQFNQAPAPYTTAQLQYNNAQQPYNNDADPLPQGLLTSWSRIILPLSSSRSGSFESLLEPQIKQSIGPP